MTDGPIRFVSHLSTKRGLTAPSQVACLALAATTSSCAMQSISAAMEPQRAPNCSERRERGGTERRSTNEQKGTKLV